uniref:Uncharacterized protein n=1 Tax=Opuntia streptacantha TaxID=393608 RepID=A0A7C9DCI9_OPUST
MYISTAASKQIYLLKPLVLQPIPEQTTSMHGLYYQYDLKTVSLLKSDLQTSSKIYPVLAVQFCRSFIQTEVKHTGNLHLCYQKHFTFILLMKPEVSKSFWLALSDS